MGADGGIAFIPVNPGVTLEEACKYLSPFFEFDRTGSDWGDDSRSDWLRENDVGHAICVPYGTDMGDCMMADGIMDFVNYLQYTIKELEIDNPTFGDIVLDRQTRPYWLNSCDNMEDQCYEAVKEAEGTHKASVTDWIEGLKKILHFTKPWWSKDKLTVVVWRAETWT